MAETGESSTCTLQRLAESVRAELDKSTRDECLSRRSIFRVPKLLREANEDAYTPNFVSIGPYHHKDDRFQKAVDYKLGFLKTFISCRGHAADTQNKEVLSFLKIIKEEETEIRGYYADPIDLSSDEFIRMVLLDGAFIIEFLRKYCPQQNTAENENLLVQDNRIHEVARDMLLLENQLPYFILDKLFSMAYKKSSIHELFSVMVFRYLNLGIQPRVSGSLTDVHQQSAESSTSPCTEKTDAHQHYHLLDFVWRLSIPADSLLSSKYNEKNRVSPHNDISRRDHHSSITITSDQSSSRASPIAINRGQKPSVFSLKCTASLTATRLHEAGVTFEMIDSSEHGLFGIHFEENKTTLRIPRLRSTEDPITQSLFRNFVALEQCMYLSKAPTYFTDYHYFLDCLINTPQDVQLLADEGLVENSLGSEVLCDMLNTISKNTRFVPQTYFYAELSEKLIRHCTPWNRYIATFKHKYFKHPWAAISVISAIIILIFTVIQVITGILAVVDVSLYLNLSRYF